MQQEVFQPDEQIPCLNQEQRERVEQAIGDVFPDFDNEYIVDGYAVTYCIDNISIDTYQELLNQVSKVVDASFTVSIHERDSHTWLYITDIRPDSEIGY
jgi:hypothetical protein